MSAAYKIPQPVVVRLYTCFALLDLQTSDAEAWMMSLVTFSISKCSRVQLDEPRMRDTRFLPSWYGTPNCELLAPQRIVVGSVVVNLQFSL